MGIFNGNRVTRDFTQHHQNGHGQDSDDIRRYALPGPASEAISRSGTPVYPAYMESVAVQDRQTVYPAHEVAMKLGRLDQRLVAFHDFDPQASAPYNQLAISLISAAYSRKLRRVLIASAQNGDGRTVVTHGLFDE